MPSPDSLPCVDDETMKHTIQGTARTVRATKLFTFQWNCVQQVNYHYPTEVHFYTFPTTFVFIMSNQKY